MSNPELARAPITVDPIGRQHGPEPESNLKSQTIELGSAPIREHGVRPLCLQILCLLRKCAKPIGTCFLNAKVFMTQYYVLSQAAERTYKYNTLS